MFEFRTVSQLSTQDKLMLAGAIAMGAGTLSPIVSIPMIGGINYFAHGHGDGTIVLFLACAVFVAVFFGFRRTGALIGLVSLVVMGVTLMKVFDALSKFHKEIANNPFGTLLSNSIGLEWGWIPLAGGALMIIGAGVNGAGPPEDAGSSHASRPERSDYSSGLDGEAGWARDIDQKIDRYMQQTVPQHSRPPIQRAFGKRVGS